MRKARNKVQQMHTNENDGKGNTSVVRMAYEPTKPHSTRTRLGVDKQRDTPQVILMKRRHFPCVQQDVM